MYIVSTTYQTYFQDEVGYKQILPILSVIRMCYKGIAELHELGIELFNSLKLRQNGCHFADDIVKCIFVNENLHILIKISLNFIPKGPIDNNPAPV